MNYSLVVHTLGKVLMLEAVLMIPSLFVSFYYGEGDSNAFIVTITILAVLGFLLSLKKTKKTNLFARDGMMIVSLAWVSIALFGGLPFWISGAIPSYVDCIFESISGFTTTGSTILTNVEAMPKGLLFWRSFTHWIGGMGVLVFFLALLPSMGGRTQHLLKAESPGPSPGKIVPKIKDTSKILYSIYFLLTLLCIICLIIAGMPVYDSIVHAFGTAGTGGFGIKNNGIEYYNSPLIYMILSMFMVAFGINFTLYYQIIRRNFTEVKKNSELKMFLFMVVAITLIITLNVRGSFGSLWESFYQAFFQVSSLISTTGYTTTDYNLWPLLSKILLMAVMFSGSCAGSTAGGIKQIRIIIMLKAVKRMIKKITHPRSVIPIKVDGKVIDEDQISSIGIFCFVYFLIFGLAVILLSFDNYDFETTFSSVLATISNIGPAFGLAGPTANFAFYSDFSKIILSLCMLIGRLEIFPVLLMLNVNSWKRV
jgi:trk system potassium uptake protein